MYKRLEFTGKKSRKIERIVCSLHKIGEQSTHEIKSLFQTGKLCATMNELSNILRKSGLFKISGRTTVSKLDSNTYEICKWKINYDGLVKKYKVDKFNRKKSRSQYILDVEMQELYFLPLLIKTELWEEIKVEIGEE
jgi:hypothetical protein